MKQLFKKAASLVKDAKRVLIVQAENPDADSLGTALALGDILLEQEKAVFFYCPVNLPRHLRYLKGWEAVSTELPSEFDLMVIVDTSAAVLLEKMFTPANASRLKLTTTLIIDHHDGGKVDLPIDKITAVIDSSAVASSQLLFELATDAGWPITKDAAVNMVASVMSDSLGLTSHKTTARTIYILAKLVDKYGVDLAALDEARREWGKKPIEILRYKGELLQRIEYYLNNRLALLTVPLEEIEKYSDKYNPAALVIEETRHVEEVDITIVLKDYRDRITGKLRANKTLVCDKIAEQFGGGGHPFAAGFKTRDKNAADLKKELIEAVKKHLA